MRFITAVALAAVMLWVPVDGVAQRIQHLRENERYRLESGVHCCFTGSWGGLLRYS